MFNPGKYYRPDEVAEILSIDRATVYRLIKDIDTPLPAIKINGLLRVHGKDLNEWVEKNKVNNQ